MKLQLTLCAVVCGAIVQTAAAQGSDNCATAQVIMGQGMFTFDQTSATIGTEGQGEPLCGYSGSNNVGRDVWFLWTADATGQARISTCGASDITKLAAYPGAAGCPMAPGTALACGDNLVCGIQSLITFDCVSGTSYLLQVGVRPGATIFGTNMEPLDISIDPPFAPYRYDFGTVTGGLGLVNGGEMLWLNGFQADGGSDTITDISTIFGSPGGTSAPPGTPIRIAIWNDPTNDFDPTDAILLHEQPEVILTANADTLDNYPLTVPQSVSGVFFVGVSVPHLPGEFPGPQDHSVNSLGRAWFTSVAAMTVLDLTDLSALGPNEAVDMQTFATVINGTTFDCVWATRASSNGMGIAFPEACNGDGGDQMGCSSCPCGNDAPMGTVGGCLNSASTAMRLNASGTNSIAAADLRIEASGAPPLNSCQLTSGNALAPANAANPCFGLNSGIQSVNLDGLRCVVQSVLRHGVRPSDANGDVGVTTNGWGTPNGFFNFGAFTAGATKHFQIINRDDAMAVCQTGQNTSQAVTVTFTM